MRAFVAVLSLTLLLMALPAAAGEVTVLLPAPDAAGRAFNDEIAARFMELNPGTTVTYQYVAGSGQTLDRAVALIAAGAPPDLMYMSPTALEPFAALGAIEDLTPWIQRSGTDLSQLHPQALLGYQQYGDGELLGLPRMFQHHAMVYNADMFAQLGMIPIGFGTTWDDFAAAIQRLTRDTTGDGNYDEWGFWWRGWYRTPTFFMPMLHAFGGAVFNADRSGSGLLLPDTVRAFESMFELYRAYEPPFSTNAILGLRDSGRLAMWYDLNTAMVDYNFPFEWGVAPIPAEKNGHGIGLYDVGLAMLKDSQNKEEAWSFLEFAISYEAQRVAAEYGFIPVRSDVVSEGNLFAALPAHVEEALLLNIMSANVNSLGLLAGPHYSDVNTILGDGLLALKNDPQVPVRPALEEMDRLIDGVLARPWPPR